MRSILLRAPKDPFSVRSAEETVERNIIGGNSGNLLFVTAAHKLLSVPGIEIVPDRFQYSPRHAARIGERHDAYVIPLANAFRLSFQPILDRMTAIIARGRIPVSVLGVGVQAPLSADWSALRPIDRSVRAFVGAVLDHGPSIGVRGEITAEYLRSLGFRDVDVIGCPSLFLWGDQLRIMKPSEVLRPDARISMTISPYVKAMGPIVSRHLDGYPNLTYVAQDLATLDRLVWGAPARAAGADDPIPVHAGHPLFRSGRVRFYLDPWPWVRDLREVDFSFGTRIHGTIAALVAGTPAVVLAHDSRTLELAGYFGIPFRLLDRSDMQAGVDAAELYAAADFTSFNSGHAARFAAFTAYLARHRLEHVFDHPGAAAAWDARAEATPYPPAVVGPGPLRSAGASARAGRLGWRLYRAARLGARAIVRFGA